MPKTTKPAAGDELLALTISASCAPTIEARVSPGTDTARLAREIEAGIEALVVRKLGPTATWNAGRPQVTVHPRSGPAVSPAERGRQFRELLAPLREQFAAATAEHAAAAANHPDNGKRGYWLVSGVRHRALIEDAASAPEAITRAAAVIEEWELPDARFLGERLPGGVYGW